MKEKLGAIARIHCNISSVTISKKMMNTHEKLFLLEKLFTHITLTKSFYVYYIIYIIICSRWWLIWVIVLYLAGGRGTGLYHNLYTQTRYQTIISPCDENSTLSSKRQELSCETHIYINLTGLSIL